MKKTLSVIITVLNDPHECLLTIKSIKNTNKNNIDIIVIDDCSDISPHLHDKNIIYLKNNKRIGVGQSRHLGAALANSKYLLFIDSHMRFKNEWYEKSIYHLNDNPNTLFCTICLGLEENHMDINKPKGRYYGADLMFFRKETGEILESKWRGETKRDEVPCIMGANYFIDRDFFFKLGGLHELKMYGMDEVLLSIKTWLSGGNIKIMKDVEIGHKFRNFSPYATENFYILYNKIRIIKTFFPENLQDYLMDKFIKTDNFTVAMSEIKKDLPLIQKDKIYYKKNFKYDMSWLINKFNIEI